MPYEYDAKHLPCVRYHAKESLDLPDNAVRKGPPHEKTAPQITWGGGNKACFLVCGSSLLSQGLCEEPLRPHVRPSLHMCPRGN